MADGPIVRFIIEDASPGGGGGGSGRAPSGGGGSGRGGGRGRSPTPDGGDGDGEATGGATDAIVDAFLGGKNSRARKLTKDLGLGAGDIKGVAKGVGQATAAAAAAGVVSSLVAAIGDVAKAASAKVGQIMESNSVSGEVHKGAEAVGSALTVVGAGLTAVFAPAGLFVAAVGGFVKALSGVGEALNALTDSFLRQARRLADVSPEIAAADAWAEIRKFRTELKDARALGPGMARLISTESRTEAVMADALRPIKESLLPLAEGWSDLKLGLASYFRDFVVISDFFRRMGDQQGQGFAQRFADGLKMQFPEAAAWFDLIADGAKAIKERADREKAAESDDLFKEFYNALGLANQGVPGLEIPPLPQGQAFDAAGAIGNAVGNALGNFGNALGGIFGGGAPGGAANP